MFYRRFFTKPDPQPAASDEWNPSTPVTLTDGAGQATSYAAAALRREADAVANTTEGSRNSQLNTSAYNMGRHVGAGSIDADTVKAALETAGRACGLPQHEIETVLRDDPTSALKAGQAHPRHPTPRPEVPAPTVLGAAASEPPAARTVRLTSAADIKIRPVHWLWADRIALGTLALLGGREGIGKSTVAYQIVADLTRGRLHGTSLGQPRAVIVAATEDSWEHTIVPRLMAADADLQHVYRVDVHTYAGFETGLNLPRDLPALEGAVNQVQAALILLDPLMSRLDANLDTHKDAEVRQALEPLVAIANRTNAAILGLIHVNKSVSTDPLTMLMGSRAFAAVARAVLFCMVDPDDEDTRILGQPKNNLGRIDLPTLTFRIVSAHVADTDEGAVWTGRIDWQANTTRSLSDVLEAATEGSTVRTATQEAADWLTDWLTTQGGTDESANIKRAGSAAGHNNEALRRARGRLGLEVSPEGFPRKTFWSLPGTRLVVSPVGETTTTDTTDTTGQQSRQSRQSRQSDDAPRDVA